jgi:hypothetical protein
MKLLSRIYPFLIVLVIGSCKSTSRIHGTYILEKNAVVSMRLTLNEDGSFVQFISERHCLGNWYFGFYKIKSKNIYLNQLSFPSERLWKNDTIVYYYDTLFKKNGLFVYDNGKSVANNAEIYINNHEFLGKTDNKGFIELPSGIPIDSISIKTTVGMPKTLKVAKNKYNMLFVIVYDYGFEPCGDLFFQKIFKIRCKKIIVGADNHFVKKGYEGYLNKIETER